jgi:SAM-dependent methyltransferase
MLTTPTIRVNLRVTDPVETNVASVNCSVAPPALWSLRPLTAISRPPCSPGGIVAATDPRSGASQARLDTRTLVPHDLTGYDVHDTAYLHGRLFFELYGSHSIRTVVELGSQDVNGSLRDHCPPGVHYIGLDVIPARGVDLVVDPEGHLPLATDAVDVVVTSSALEHDVCFWETFLELIRILRPGGLLYVNAPSNGVFHRYPVDCWRFYPDAGLALVRWAARRGLAVELVESFIGPPQRERWADFVAVFRKLGGAPLRRKGRIATHASGLNVHDITEPMLRETGAGPPDPPVAHDHHAAAATPAESHVPISGEYAAAAVAAARQEAAALRTDVATRERRIRDLTHALGAAREEISTLRNSRWWRLTAAPRRLFSALRG